MHVNTEVLLIPSGWNVHFMILDSLYFLLWFPTANKEGIGQMFRSGKIEAFLSKVRLTPLEIGWQYFCYYGPLTCSPWNLNPVIFFMIVTWPYENYNCIGINHDQHIRLQPQIVLGFVEFKLLSPNMSK